jgi:hypothetical protein
VIIEQKGELTKNIPSGVQEISYTTDRHVYFYDGRQGELVRIQVTVHTETCSVFFITYKANSKQEGLVSAAAMQPGADIEVRATFPGDGSYEMHVAKRGSTTCKYEILVE